MSITGLPGNIPHQGLKERNPPELHISKVRGPTSSDSGHNFDIGDIWIDLLGDDAYILVSKDAGVAIWILMSAVSGNVDFLTGDAGGPVGPDGAGNINILGGSGITTTGNPGTDTITIDADGTVAVSVPVDNGGPAVPSAGSLSLLGKTSTDFPNPSGIETHVGATTNEIYYENRRFLSDLVVDPSAVVGLRGEFTTISAALTAAVSGDTIYIRPGTYVENITLIAGVNLLGSTTSGSSSAVIIDGSIKAEYNGTVEVKNIRIAPAAGDSILSTAGTPSIILNQCDVVQTTGTVCSSANSSLIFSALLSNLNSAPATNLLAPTAGQYSLTNSVSTQSGSGSILASGTSVINISNSVINHDVETTGTSVVVCSNSVFVTGTTETFNINSAGSSINSSHNTISSSAASGNFVIGTGTFIYADIVLLTSAQNIAGTITEIISDWKPYATAASTEPSVDKGTSGYDSNDFTVTNGFVQLVHSSGGFTWQEITGTTVSLIANNGYILNNAALVTATLPTTCVIGDTIQIVGKGIGGWLLAQGAGQVVHFGNQDTTLGIIGSIASTLRYDCIEFVCTFTNTEWTVIDSVGNVTVI